MNATYITKVHKFDKLYSEAEIACSSTCHTGALRSAKQRPLVQEGLNALSSVPQPQHTVRLKKIKGTAGYASLRVVLCMIPSSVVSCSMFLSSRFYQPAFLRFG